MNMSTTTEAKHTPGPWRVEFRLNRLMVRAGDADVVAVAMPDEPQSKENAALIAAAPELLGALQAICEFWDFATTEEGMSTPLYPGALIGGHDGDDPITIHDAVRAAIAKATGRS